MFFEWTVNVGNLLTLVSFLAGGLWFVITMKNGLETLSLRLKYVENSFEEHKKEINKLSQILVTLGRYEERFLRVEGMIDDLRHGQGFIRKPNV